MLRPSPEVLEECLKQWGLEGEPVFIRNNENCVYELSEKEFILRFTEPSHRTRDELLGELRWIEALSEPDPLCFSRPIVNKKGNILSSIEDDGREYFVSVFTKAKGASLKDESEYTAATYRRLGQIIGRMHKFESQNSQCFSRREWDADLGFLGAKAVARPKDGRPYQIFQQALRWLESLPKEESCFGLVHSDIHQGNFFIDVHGGITLFDFDDGQRHWFAYDLAVPLFSLESSGLVHKISERVIGSCQNALLEGYQAEYELGDQWLERLPHFIVFRTILLFYWGQSRIENNLVEADVREKILKMMEDCLLRLQPFESFPKESSL